MKHRIEKWKVIDLYKDRDKIQYPYYQRSPNIWNEEKRAKLIDSIVNGIPIPLIFLYEQNGGDSYDCVDGQQRIQSIMEFLDGHLTTEYGNIDRITERVRVKIENYELSIVIIEDADEDDLRKLFIRLQLGAPLNAGEKLNATTGEMRDLIFKRLKEHPFIQKVNIPSRRFSKEQVLAQICINSFSLALKGTFQSARFEKLLSFFEQYEKLDRYHQEVGTIERTLNILDKYFGDDARRLTNRALVLTAYLFIENLIKNDPEENVPIFVQFYLRFIEKLKEQASLGLDYDKRYRKIVDFYTYVTQAAFEPYSISRRAKIIEDFFSYFKQTGRIMEDVA
ncbi:MAG: DUF262 domain-containing protein [Candidatus Aenigmarchaeota archaeon]|nr:DUF262 domain-containing protein [Candidatus Aenigmarchaeota archaeon]